MQAKRAFTLIEVLTVIAIIGILSAIILVSVSSSQKKGRDGRRISDINQIRLALSLYYDANSKYPTTGSGNTASTIASALTSANYISVMPDDPTSGNHYVYVCSSASGGNCYSYVLIAGLEAFNTILSTSYSPSAGTVTATVNGASVDCNNSNQANGKTFTGSGGATYYLYCATN